MYDFLTDAILEKYDVLQKKSLPDVNSQGVLLRHKKSGARVVLLPNDDNNKVFFIAFRTPPADSTGVAHIIEHTVLCGSRDFPVRDPFIELAKGSLNTFLNAMTYPDKTVYPVASCNDTDFANLMHVYLDAVFYPNIYKEERIFRQEGWHYEADSADSEITVNGVVYNEMKGALSSADDVLARDIFSTLYPDTPYAFESGGDPVNIPDLKYEDYLDFHRKYYHPSNSYIYLYGDMDMEERLTYLDEAYLSAFDTISVDSEIPAQEPFTVPREFTEKYSILKDEDPAGKSYLSWNVSLAQDGLDSKMINAFKVIDYAISDAEGAPLRKALRERKIGEDVYSILETGIRMPGYSVIAKYSDPEKKDLFVQTINETLEKIVRDGFDEKSLLAGINYYEFRYRESDFGSYPKGLVYGLSMMDSWLYDDSNPWIGIDAGAVFTELRSEVGSGYFENLIQTYLLDNPHKSILILEPEAGLTEKRDAELKEKLAKMAAGMTREQREQIVADLRSLHEWQQTPEKKEDLEKIPMLTRADLSDAIVPYANEYSERDGIRRLYHPVFTNRIHYLSFLFDIGDLPKELFPYLGIFKTALSAVDTKLHDYAALNKEIDILTGGVSCSVSTYTDYRTMDRYTTWFEVHVKVLHENLKAAFDLVQEILMQSDYSKADRLLEILEEERAGMRADLAASGHITASGRAVSYISKTGAVMETISGISAYQTLDKVCQQLEKGDTSICAVLDRIAKAIFCRDNLVIDCTAEAEDLRGMESYEQNFVQGLHEKHESGDPFDPELEIRNEGFTTAGQVQYVCRVGDFRKHGLNYTADLKVLRIIMAYDYLWTRIRMNGGAYGCMSSYSRDGIITLVSYRDPHLKKTIDVFEGAADYIDAFDCDERTMTKYIIGTVSGMDHPMTPSQKGKYSRSGFMTHLPQSVLEEEKKQVLKVQPSDIRGLGKYLRAAMEDPCLCVVGNDQKLRSEKELFKSVQKLTD